MFGTYGEEATLPRHFSFRVYLRQQPVMLALLSVLVVLFFLFVAGLSRAHYAQRQALGSRWFNRGVADLNSNHFSPAVTEFRTALLYSRDNYEYQLNLAEALVGLKHTGEASAYLINLWDREPDNGLVNLELARIATQQGQTREAIRYYHDAIYAAWPGDQEWKRRDARLELIDFLLRINAKADAQSELIALSENVGEDPVQQEHIGDLFLRSQDYQRALAAYRTSLKSDRHNEADLAGAGYAAVELGLYREARQYLKAAVAYDPNDAASADRLKTTEQVLEMDPFRRQITAAQRSRIVLKAFATAGQRLKSCTIPQSVPSTVAGPLPNLNNEWATAKAKVSEQRLLNNPELTDTTMDLVFRIERQASISCGTPTGPDLALLLIAKMHEGM